MPDLMPPRAFGLRALLFRQPRDPSAIAVTHGQSVYPVRVQRNRRARRYTLRIQAALREVVLTMPVRGSLTQARDFAQRHGAWIAARLTRLPQPVALEPGAVVPLRGEPHRIVHRPDRRGTVWTETGAPSGGADERLLCVAGASGHLARRLRDFLKREAKRDLDAATRAAAQRLGVTVKRVSVRDQASRWGSCSTTGVLSYSWRLILAPPFVLNYLAAHEVAHLVEMNHSAAFWRLVKRLDPEMATAKAWIAAHGGDLHRYDPPRRRGAAATPH